MNAKHHERRGRRSRLLGSIFAAAPDNTPHAGERHRGAVTETGATSAKTGKSTAHGSWRDVTAAHARTGMAEDICTRFFAEPPQDDRDSCAGRLDGGMVTAGQRLQALANGRVVADTHGIAASALAGCSREPADTQAERHAESAGACLQSLVSAKAA